MKFYKNNGKKSTGMEQFDFIVKADQSGAGEIVTNSIDKDGEMKGFDLALFKKSRKMNTLPMTFLGGAGSWVYLGKIIEEQKIVGVATGSLFVFKGKYKAVLMNYPNKEQKEKLFT